MTRTGLIISAKSHRNRLARGAERVIPGGVISEVSGTHAELDVALARFAERGIDLLVVDGGDGAVRDVLTQAPTHFGPSLPRIAVIPAGKTNALALALGAPRGWTLDDALARANAGAEQLQSPLEVVRPDGTVQRGFLFGVGAFVQATGLAQSLHSMGAFNSLAVGLTMAGAIRRTLFGGAREGWRAGESVTLSRDGGVATTSNRFLVLASTLKRLPLGVRPFGRAREGLRTLVVETPPKKLLWALPPILMGAEPRWLDRAGYMRRTVQTLEMSLEAGFVLDGEIFPGGDFILRTGAPIRFVAP